MTHGPSPRLWQIIDDPLRLHGWASLVNEGCNRFRSLDLFLAQNEKSRIFNGLHALVLGVGQCDDTQGTARLPLCRLSRNILEAHSVAGSWADESGKVTLGALLRYQEGIHFPKTVCRVGPFRKT